MTSSITAAERIALRMYLNLLSDAEVSELEKSVNMSPARFKKLAKRAMAVYGRNATLRAQFNDLSFEELRGLFCAVVFQSVFYDAKKELTEKHRSLMTSKLINEIMLSHISDAAIKSIIDRSVRTIQAGVTA